MPKITASCGTQVDTALRKAVGLFGISLGVALTLHFVQLLGALRIAGDGISCDSDRSRLSEA